MKTKLRYVLEQGTSVMMTGNARDLCGVGIVPFLTYGSEHVVHLYGTL